jgi:IMP dehydrogenase/GMP reductase
MFAGKTFDDFLLRPRYGVVRSRQHVTTESALYDGLSLKVPVLSANMDLLTGVDLALAVGRAGGCGVVPRRTPGRLTPPQIVAAVKAAGYPVGAAIGADWTNDTVRALMDAGADFLVVDIAHGHSIVMEEALGQFREMWPDYPLGAGNVATFGGASDLKAWGATFIKVGIGAGSCCTTRLKTGVGVPQLQAIWECSRVGVPVLADGGIRQEKDIALALLCGARAVMLGGFLAGTDEAVSHNCLRGMASSAADPDQTAPPEGIVRSVSPQGSAETVLQHVAGYLRSTISYLGESSLAAARVAVMARPAHYLIPLSMAAQEESWRDRS